MGKEKQRAEGIQVHGIPIQNDPYWKISGIYMDAHRIGRFISRFERFEDQHPEWTDCLMNGIPTYYCVLGVEREATKNEIVQAYERKLKFSSYPNEVIEDAYNVLSNLRLQKEYDELLFTFEQVTKCMHSSDKNELIKNHNSCITIEKEYIRMGQILSKYRDYAVLYMHGMPDIYEITGIKKDSTAEEIRRRCRADSDLMKRICTLFAVPASREEYDFMLGFIAKYTGSEHLKEREREKKKWRYIDRSILERILLAALNEPDAIEKYMQRQIDILNINQDWKQYLPPAKETFLSILGLNADSIRDNRKEVERVMRERYRQLEKTPQVNLAYSVLKNTSQREDYLWLLENHKMLNTLASLLPVREIPEEIERDNLPKTRERINALIRLFADRQNKRGKDGMPDTLEMIDLLRRTFEKEIENEGPKKIEKRKIKPGNQKTFDVFE